MPSAIARQNRRRTSRRIVGAPNDPNFGRTGLFNLAIANNTFHDQVLRRPLEPGHLFERGVVRRAGESAVVDRGSSGDLVIGDVMGLSPRKR
jgi:hypothetical protein